MRQRPCSCFAFCLAHLLAWLAEPQTLRETWRPRKEEAPLSATAVEGTCLAPLVIFVSHYYSALSPSLVPLLHRVSPLPDNLMKWFLPQAQGSSTYLLSFTNFSLLSCLKGSRPPSTGKPLTSALTLQKLSLARGCHDTRSKCICIMVFISCNTEILVLIQLFS